jgi:hypothetical protein
MEASPGPWDLESFDDFAVWATSLGLLPKTKLVRRALVLLNELSNTVVRISGLPLEEPVDIPSAATPATIPPSSVDDSLFLPSPIDQPAPLPVVEPELPRPRPKTRGGGSSLVPGAAGSRTQVVSPPVR